MRTDRLSYRQIFERFLVAAFVVSVIGLFLIPANRSSPEAARRAQCVNNLKQIGIALYNYESMYGRFPPAFVKGPDGRPWHSWRVLILPFLEQQDLYLRYNFDEPWDGPNNISLLPLMPNVYACPSIAFSPQGRPTATSFFAITGPGSAFANPDGMKLSQFLDGTGDTIAIVESDTTVIPWTAPGDLNISTISHKVNHRVPPAISSKHYQGANVLFVEGMVRFLKNSVSPETIKALFTSDAGDKPGVDY